MLRDKEPVSAGALTTAALLEKEPAALSPKGSRQYLYELDRLRIVTALSVVAVHVTALMTFLDATVPALQAQNAFVTLFHFTRAVFMFVTAFALVYVYQRKQFTWGDFWKRRGLGVVFPYVFWSVIYFLQDPHPNAPLPFMQALFIDVLDGQASYQLYYILLTVQFYVLFPFYLKGLRRAAQHPWVTLGISFALELGTLYAINNLQNRPGGISYGLNQFLESFVLIYQFYFVLGGLVALNMSSVREFLLRHGRLVVAAFIVTLAALELNYFGSLYIVRASMDAAVAVLQPVMVFYSTAIIFLLYWLAYRQVSRMAQPGAARGQRIWHALSDSAFGIYLIHPLILTALISLVSAYFMGWSPIVIVPLAWLITAGGSVACTLLLLRIPFLSRLVGRAAPMPLLPAVSAWRRKIVSLFSWRERLPLAKLKQWEDDARPGEALRSEQTGGALPPVLDTGERGAMMLARKEISS